MWKRWKATPLFATRKLSAVICLRGIIFFSNYSTNGPIWTQSQDDRWTQNYSTGRLMQDPKPAQIIFHRRETNPIWPQAAACRKVSAYQNIYEPTSPDTRFRRILSTTSYTFHLNLHISPLGVPGWIYHPPNEFVYFRRSGQNIDDKEECVITHF